MEKTITRTLNFFDVAIKDGETGQVLKTETVTAKPSKEKIAIKYIKETGKTNIIVDIEEKSETREISLSDFMQYSKVVDKTPVKE